MSIGQNIKQMRTELNLSQEAIGRPLGLSRQTISRYETGKIGNIPFETVEALAEILMTTPSALMGWKEDTPPVTDSFPSNNIHPPLKTRQVPRVGNIACGSPILAEENILQYDSIPDYIQCDFTLVCKGDSMINARIFDGDLVCIRQQPEVENGEIAAVMVGEDQATLKRIRRFKDHIILEPANPSHSPKIFWGEEMNQVRIIGKATYFISPVR